MDKNRIEGSIKEIKGAAKEAVGKVVGDAKLQSDGKADRAVGKNSERRRRPERRGQRRSEEAVTPPLQPRRISPDQRSKY